MLEILYDIKILHWGPGSYFYFIIPRYISDNVYNKSFGTYFYARKCKMKFTSTRSANRTWVHFGRQQSVIFA